jgi:hypothetical protein
MMKTGTEVIFQSSPAGTPDDTVELFGTVARVWDKPAADPYVTILDADGRTFVRCSSRVMAI